MLCRHLSAHKLSATEEQPSQRERGTEHCVKERERKGGREEVNEVDRVRKEEKRKSRRSEDGKERKKELEG